MSFEIIPKKDTIPEFDHQEIKLKHILYYPNGEEYEEDEITEEVISRILKEIPEGIEIYLSLDSYGEDDWLEVVCDGSGCRLPIRPKMSIVVTMLIFLIHIMLISLIQRSGRRLQAEDSHQ